MVNAIFKRRKNGIGANSDKFCENIARKLDSQKLPDHRGQPFAGFERDIADKTVADHDIGHTLENIVPLDIAVKIQIAGAGSGSKQFTRFFDNFIAFDDLFTNIEKAYRRI